MSIIEHIKVPTGDILVVKGEKGLLECLSLADYGKDVNIKCDALGLHRVPSEVRHTNLLPLEEKWVCTISTQYGCSMGCTFCDVPKVGPGRNVTFNDMVSQVRSVLNLHPGLSTRRLNVHFARMGEPTFNSAVLEVGSWLHRVILPVHSVVHPVVSTMLPKKNKWLKLFIHAWMDLKNHLYDGNAGLQLSINSTDDVQRSYLFGGNSLSLQSIAYLFRGLIPKGRKITLNFAVAEACIIEPDKLLKAGFDPDRFIVKLTPMHETVTAGLNDLHTVGNPTTYAPYEKHEENFKSAGYDVLVFIASREEDRSRITCGNAVLAGVRPDSEFILS